MGAVFLFGLAGLFFLNILWPGILVLIWLTAFPILLAEHGWLGFWIAIQTTIWLLGLPFLFMTHLLWPGILVLAGCSALLTAVFHPSDLDRANQMRRAEMQRRYASQQAKEKRKRGLPLPYEGDNHSDLYEDDDWQFTETYDPDADERPLRAHRH
jgi:hypothetical protein